MANVTKVKVIEIGGKTYLGEIEKAEGVVVVKNALAVDGNLSLEHIGKYIIAELTGVLTEKTISGPGLCYTESALDRDQSLKMQIENLIMLEAKSRGEQGLTADIYAKIKGNLSLGK